MDKKRLVLSLGLDTGFTGSRKAWYSHLHSGVSLERGGSGMPLLQVEMVWSWPPSSPGTPAPQYQSMLPTTVCEKLRWDPVNSGMSPHPHLRCGYSGKVESGETVGLGVVPTVQSRPSACLWGGHGAPCCCTAPLSPHRCTAQGSADSAGSCFPHCLWRTQTG